MQTRKKGDRSRHKMQLLGRPRGWQGKEQEAPVKNSANGPECNLWSSVAAPLYSCIKIIQQTYDGIAARLKMPHCKSCRPRMSHLDGGLVDGPRKNLGEV